MATRVEELLVHQYDPIQGRWLSVRGLRNVDNTRLVCSNALTK
jgi:hypothetical protein